MKKLHAPYSLWAALSAKSTKFDAQQRQEWWAKAKIHNYTVNSLIALAKEGNLEEYVSIDPLLNHTKNVFDDGSNYLCIAINIPFLTTKRPGPAYTQTRRGSRASRRSSHKATASRLRCEAATVQEKQLSRSDE